MGYDEALADRVRDQISARANISEKRMFGSNLAVCVRKDELLVRLEAEDAERAIAEEGVRVAEMGSRRMKGWVFIAAERVSEDDCLAEWVEAGATFAASLPSK